MAEPGGSAQAGPSARAGVSGRITRYLYDLRTEGAGRGRQAAAVGLGVFIGCSPFFGAHFWICIAAGWLLGLNRVKMYLAANISNPLIAPLLVFSEIQSGHWLRTGAPYALSLSALRLADPWHFAADLLLGSLAVGSLLGALAAGATWAVVKGRLAPEDEGLVADAALGYLPVGIAAWEMANGKLRLDPCYLEAIRLSAWPDEGTIVDLGCGRGLMLALLAAFYDRRAQGATWRVRLRGIEYRPRMVKLARRALGGRAVIDQADLATCPLPRCRVAMLFDVLHCLPEPAQEALLARVRDAVEPGGALIVREADAGGGWAFAAGQSCNRTVAILQGRWGRRFHFRTADGWVELFARSGFAADAPPRRESGLYANVLLRATRTAD